MRRIVVGRLEGEEIAAVVAVMVIVEVEIDTN